MLIPIILLLVFILNVFVTTTLGNNFLAYQNLMDEHKHFEQFKSAEKALSHAEKWLLSTSLLPEATAICVTKPCVLLTKSPEYFPKQSIDWWKNAYNMFVMPVIIDEADFSIDAFYTIEKLIKSSHEKVTFYRITAFAQINEKSLESAPTVLQSVFKKEGEKIGGRTAWRRWPVSY